MRKIFLSTLLFLAISQPALSEAVTKTVVIDWAMSNITDVQGYKVYYSYTSGMENKIWLQDCGAAEQTGTDQYSITCNNVSLDTFPVYFSISAVTADGEISSATQQVEAPVTVVKNFGLLMPNIAPTASISSSSTQGYVPLAVSFDGSSSTDPDGSIVSYLWNFGDGTTGTGATISHTFSAIGTFPVTLTVTDDKGSTFQSQTTVTTAEVPASISPPVTAPSYAINFQPANAPSAVGFLTDSGLAYDSNRGYGWTPVQIDTRDRNNVASPDQSYDTLILAAASAVWEYNLAPGTYYITICVGDPWWAYSTNVIKAEGVQVVNDTVDSTHKWIEKTAVVTVNDGRLTLSFQGSTPHSQLCWIKIYAQ